METNLPDTSKIAASPLKSVAKLTGHPIDVTQTLTDRGKKYGPFKGHAEVTQDLKAVAVRHLYDRNKQLDADQQEALDMIFHKIGRIVNGDANYDDSWIDIAGYAQLVADRLRGVTR
jgi:hypothetical protein